jgi:predicted MPP superfamily phosphohydrolase
VTAFVTAAAVLSGALAVAVCAAIVAGRRVTVLTALGGLVTLAAATFVVLVVGVVQGLDLFGIAHVLYLQAALAVPLLGAGLLGLCWWRPHSTAAIGLAAVLLVPALIGIWSSHIAPFQLRVDEHRVPVSGSAAGSGTVRFAVLADLQTTGIGDHERAAVRAVMDAEPDVILLPGDLFQADGETLEEQGPAVRELLAQLEAPHGVYLVQGDVDTAERWQRIVPPDVTVLDDEVVELRIRDRVVHLGGTRLDVSSAGAESVRDQLAATERDLTVLMSHRPDTVLYLPTDSGVDLTVAGHTHGGQIAVPLFGPPLTLSQVPRDVGAGGLHEVDGNPIYVSTGVGMERGQAPQVRLLVPPSVGVLDLG